MGSQWQGRVSTVLRIRGKLVPPIQAAAACTESPSCLLTSVTTENGPLGQHNLYTQYLDRPAVQNREKTTLVLIRTLPLK